MELHSTSGLHIMIFILKFNMTKIFLKIKYKILIKYISVVVYDSRIIILRSYRRKASIL
jgi:hypothetical protein